MTFVSYKTKSDAKRGLTRKNTAVEDLDPEHFLFQQDGKWGFDMKDGAPFPTPMVNQQTLLAAMQAGTDTTDHGHPEAGASAEEIAAVADKPEEGVLSKMNGNSAEAPPEDAVVEDEEHVPDAFGAFAMGQLGNAKPREPEQTRAQTITKIERNREERNGVKRPSAGTVCDQVWAIATELSNGDETPRTRIATLSEVVKASEAQGINKYTARTQYARWRGFHGIVGRVSS